MVRWLIAAGIAVAGIVIGSLCGAQVRRILGASTRTDRQRALADPAGSITLSVTFAAFLVAALGVGDRESLRTLPTSLIRFMPKLLIALLIFLVGNAVATLAANALGTSLIKATGQPQPQLVRLTRTLLAAAFAILAVSQLGVNTRIVDMVVAALVFGTALTLALLAGLGGRVVAGELAAGRYLRRILRPGDRIRSGEAGNDVHVFGEVRRLHGATVEIAQTRSTTGEDFQASDPAASTTFITIVHVPNSALLARTLRIEREAD